MELSQSKATAATALLKGSIPPRAGAVDTALRDGAIQQSCREHLRLALDSPMGFLHPPPVPGSLPPRPLPSP